MNNRNVQDWEPVVFRREKTKSEKIKSGQSTTVARTGAPNKHTGPQLSRDTLHNFDPDAIKAPVTSTIDLGRAIQSARLAKGNPDGTTMTQSDLEKACQLPKNTVRDYENGTAIYNADQVNKIARILGVKLPRPSKK